MYAKYFDTSSQDPDISSLVAAIVAQLSGTNPSGPVVDGGSFETSTTSFPFAGEAGGLTQNDQTTGAPRAYLNWLVFDSDHVLIPQKSGFKRITTAAHDTDGNGSHERIFSPQITIDQPGYLYIYISNEEETQMEVFFDDFKVDHIKSPVVQMDDYYPFGLTFNSYSRENTTPNMYQYNGKELQDELNLQWLDYGARMYMQEIGRFTTKDPMEEKFFGLSAYSYVANNPILLIDPSGRDWTIEKKEDENGKIQYNIKFTAALVNSSKNKELNLVKLAESLLSHANAVYNQDNEDFSVNFSAEIRVVGDKKDVKDSEHLIEVKDSDHKDFKTDKKGEIVAGKALNGKEISLNEKWVKYISSGVDKTTGPHEFGHTAGLRHPKHDINYYFFGLIRYGAGPTANSPETNFMHQGWISNPTGPTKEQMDRMYRLYQAGELNRKDNVPIETN